jgi:hypothetical protein
MATSLLPPDFKEFLLLLNSKEIEYLLIGGYAVGYYGYARATADIDIWIGISPENANRMVEALREFGFNLPGLTPDLFLQKDRIVRMGMPPFRIEVLTTISGVDFAECYGERVSTIIDGIPVEVISLYHLKINKKSSGRTKDLTDFEHLP